MAHQYREDLLSPMQSDPAHYSFGSKIADMTAESVRLGTPLPYESLMPIARLVDGTRRLINSTHPMDQYAYQHTVSQFNHNDMSDFASSHEGQLSSDPALDIVRWIADKDTEYRDIARLAIWNKARRNRLQQRLEENEPDFLEDSMSRVNYLTREGVYPKGAVRHYLEAIERYQTFKAMDSFESGLMMADGWCDSHQYALANLYDYRNEMHGLGEHFLSVSFHETTHAVGWAKDDDTKRGFIHGIGFPYKYHRILEEFWASHLQVASNKQASAYGMKEKRAPHVYDPRIRDDVIRSYFREAILVSRIDELTPGGLPVDLMGHAFLSPLNGEDISKPRTELLVRIAQPLGGLVMYLALEDAYEDAETPEETKTVLKNMISLLGGTDDDPGGKYTEYELADESPADLVAEFIDG